MLRKVEGLKKNSHYKELIGEWDMHSADGLAMLLGDLNEHVGRHIDGFDGVHAGNGVG